MQLKTFPVLTRPASALPDVTLTVQPAVHPWTQVHRLVQPQRWLLPLSAAAAGMLASPEPASFALAGRVLLTGLLAGPLLTTTGHVIVGYFDRDRAALEAPHTRQASDVLVAALGLLSLLSLLVGHLLGSTAFILTVVALALHFALSAPPLRLRRVTWWNGFGFGATTVMFPWLLGADALHGWHPASVTMAAIFAFGALGLHLLASLHRGVGDRRAGLRTLAALFGPEVGALIAALVIDTALLGAGILCFEGASPFTLVTLAMTFAGMLAIQLTVLPRITQLKRGRAAFLPTMVALYMLAMLVTAAAHGTPPLVF